MIMMLFYEAGIIWWGVISTFQSWKGI